MWTWCLKPRATPPVGLTSSWQCPGMTLVHMIMKCVSRDNYVSPHPVFQTPTVYMCISSYVYSPLCPLMSTTTYYVPSCLLPLCPLMSTTYHLQVSSLMSTTPQVPSCLLTPKHPHVYYPLRLPMSFALHFRGTPGPPPHLSPLPCRFVVELCDMVSVQTLEIACLELFSSVPESFNVYSAERWVWQACFVLDVISD